MIRNKFIVTKKKTTDLTEVSGQGKLDSSSRGCACKSKTNKTGSASAFYSNSGGGCVFFLLAEVQVQNLIQLANLKRFGVQEMKEEVGRGPCSEEKRTTALGQPIPRIEQWVFVSTKVLLGGEN